MTSFLRRPAACPSSFPEKILSSLTEGIIAKELHFLTLQGILEMFCI